MGKKTSTKQQKEDLEAKITDIEKTLEKILSALESKLTPKPEPATETSKGLLPKNIEQSTTQQAPPPKPEPATETSKGLLPKNIEQSTTQQAPPPKPDVVLSKETAYVTSATKRKSELEAYEREYLARLDSKIKETPKDLLPKDIEQSTTQQAPPPKPEPATETPKDLLPKDIEQSTTQQAPPPKPDVVFSKETAYVSSVISLYIQSSTERKSELEAYEREYLARLDSNAKEAAEFAAIVTEIVAKKQEQAKSSSI